jgi:hypothetical protein
MKTRYPSEVKRREDMKGLSTQTKIGLGAVLSTFGALAIVLSLLLGWSAAPRPWGFLLGFIEGVVSGLGATMVVAGLIERRTGKK